MENATKALIIAGGVLITIMIITIGIYLLGSFGRTTSSYVEQLDATALRQYNTESIAPCIPLIIETPRPINIIAINIAPAIINAFDAFSIYIFTS